MSKISYPAVFHEDGNSYFVEFPDLQGCLSSGDTIELAFENAKEALGMYLDKDKDVYERIINKPSCIKDICSQNPDSVVMLVEYDSLEYAKKYKVTLLLKGPTTIITDGEEVYFDNLLGFAEKVYNKW